MRRLWQGVISRPYPGHIGAIIDAPFSEKWHYPQTRGVVIMEHHRHHQKNHPQGKSWALRVINESLWKSSFWFNSKWLQLTNQLVAYYGTERPKNFFAKCHYPQREVGQHLIPHQECKIVTIIKVNLDLTQREVNAPNLNLIRPHSQEAGVIVIVIRIIIITIIIIIIVNTKGWKLKNSLKLLSPSFRLCWRLI